MLRKSDIIKVDQKRKEIKKELYIKLYEQLSRKIKQAVEFSQKQVFLTVPGYLIGYQPFDRFQATSWIHRQLKNGDFTVTQISDFVLHVSWVASSGTKEGDERIIECQEPEEEERDSFPTLVNLRKAANKNRKYFPGSH